MNIVVTGSSPGDTAVLNGFTVTGGNANGSHPYNHGGGMHSCNGAPTLTKCTFANNSAYRGRGMYNSGQNSNPMLTNCTFSDNSADSGGGMYNGGNSHPTLANVTFNNNSATNIGGGMANYSNPMVNSSSVKLRTERRWTRAS